MIRKQLKNKVKKRSNPKVKELDEIGKKVLVNFKYGYDLGYLERIDPDTYALVDALNGYSPMKLVFNESSVKEIINFEISDSDRKRFHFTIPESKFYKKIKMIILK